MKKIVALALSLVMVLGLATTAFAAPASTVSGLFAKGTEKDAAVVADVAVKYFAAVDNKVTAKGAYEADGNVDYYMVNDWANTYVKVAALADADLVLYTDADCKVPYMYLKNANPVYFGDGVAFANFGTACGQYNSKDAAYDKDAKYYTAFNALYVEVETSAIQLMVNGKLVPVNGPVAIPTVEHKAVITTDKKGAVESIKCAACGVVAAKAANYASLPENATVVMTEGTAYWYWTTATEAGSTVESAKTFDAGIAMYVGMSVMAAAGSAVVLKKKD